MGSFVTAVKTLSIVPVPGRDAERPALALGWFPAVGFLLGLALYGIVEGAGRLTLGVWPAGVGVLAVLSGAVLTRAIHLDGLADWADGLGVYGRENILRVMKDHHTGSFGVTALVLALLAKWASISTLAATGSGAWIVAAYIVSRTAQADMACSQPYARDTGTGAPFIGRENRAMLLPALPSAAIFCWAVAGMEGLVALAGGLLVARFFGMSCRARIGGATGDTLGACSELVETAVLAAGALAARLLQGTGPAFL